MTRDAATQVPPPSLALAVADSVAIITFDAPELLNGIDASNLNCFPRLVAEAASADARYLVVRGGARHFCSGASAALLRNLTDSTPAARIEVISRAQKWVTSLLECPLPTVGAVDGLVAGAGFDLSLAFDLRLFGPATRMNIWYAKLGVIPDLGGFDLLSDRMGCQRALELYARSATLTQADVVGLGWGEGMDRWPDDHAAWLKELTRRLPVEAAAFAAAKEFALAPLLEKLKPRQEAAGILQAQLFGEERFRERVERITALQRALTGSRN